MSEQRRKRIYVMILLSISLMVDITAKRLGYFYISGLCILFSFAVMLAWGVEVFKDKRKGNKKDKKRK